jgi:hypothetical protein
VLSESNDFDPSPCCELPLAVCSIAFGMGTILEIGLEMLAIPGRMILGSAVTIAFGARIIAEPAMAKTTLSFSLLFCNAVFSMACFVWTIQRVFSMECFL